jgi:hypothetical protein
MTKIIQGIWEKYRDLLEFTDGRYVKNKGPVAIASACVLAVAGLGVGTYTGFIAREQTTQNDGIDLLRSKRVEDSTRVMVFLDTLIKQNQRRDRIDAEREKREARIEQGIDRIITLIPRR